MLETKTTISGETHKIPALIFFDNTDIMGEVETNNEF